LNTVTLLVKDVSSSFTTIDTGRERTQRNEFKSMVRQDKDANGNMMFTPIRAARSTYVNLGRSIPVNAATLPNIDLPTDPFMPDLEDTSSEDEVADDARMKSTEVPRKENGVQDPVKEGDKYNQEKYVRDQEEALRKQFEQESKRLFSQREAANTNSTNRLNTVTLLVKDGNLQYALSNQGIFNSGCSRHMTGNKSCLIDYQEIDGGFVAF
nr:hypothetical protein [Tanacetum cinerariifolium]